MSVEKVNRPQAVDSRRINSEEGLPLAAYHSRLQKGGALLDDMRTLVRAWHGDEKLGKAQLQKATRARAHDTMIRAFIPRFINGNPREAWRLVRVLEDFDAEPEILRPIYYWLTTRNDRLLYDYVSIELCAIARSGDRRIRINETVHWIRSQLKASEQDPWSPSVTLRVARGLLAALRDFTLLEGKAIKRVASFNMPLESFCWIAFTLQKLGFTGTALVNHPDWRLFLLSPMHVENLFFQAHQNGFLEYHAAGGIFRVSFPVFSHDEYAHVILTR